MKHTRILSALIAGLLATSTLVSGLTVHAAAESGTKAAAQTYVAVSQPTTHIVGDIAMIREINSNQPISRFDEFLDQYCCYRDEDAAFKVLNLVINGKREIVLQKAPNNRKPVHLIYAGYLYSKQRNRRIKSR